MPTYLYKCSNCKDEFEVVQRMTDDKLKHCNKCENDSLERVPVNGTFLFKGSGWNHRSH